MASAEPLGGAQEIPAPSDETGDRTRDVLPRGLFRYVLENGPLMQLLVVLLTVASFLIELVIW
jgi:hypothetical protein